MNDPTINDDQTNSCMASGDRFILAALLWTIEQAFFSLSLFCLLAAPRSEGPGWSTPSEQDVVTAVCAMGISQLAAVFRKRENAVGSIAKLLIFFLFAFIMAEIMRSMDGQIVRYYQEAHP